MYLQIFFLEYFQRNSYTYINLCIINRIIYYWLSKVFVTEQNDNSGLSSWQLLLLLCNDEKDVIPLLVVVEWTIDGTWCGCVLIREEIIIVADSLISAAFAFSTCWKIDNRK
jgi:hypothetical protein